MAASLHNADGAAGAIAAAKLAARPPDGAGDPLAVHRDQGSHPVSDAMHRVHKARLNALEAGHADHEGRISALESKPAEDHSQDGRGTDDGQ